MTEQMIKWVSEWNIESKKSNLGMNEPGVGQP